MCTWHFSKRKRMNLWEHLHLIFPQGQHVGVYRRVEPRVLKNDVILKSHKSTSSRLWFIATQSLTDGNLSISKEWIIPSVNSITCMKFKSGYQKGSLGTSQQEGLFAWATASGWVKVISPMLDAFGNPKIGGKLKRWKVNHLQKKNQMHLESTPSLSKTKLVRLTPYKKQGKAVITLNNTGYCHHSNHFH